MRLSSNPKTTTEKRKTKKVDIEINKQVKITRCVHRNNSHWLTAAQATAMFSQSLSQPGSAMKVWLCDSKSAVLVSVLLKATKMC